MKNFKRLVGLLLCLSMVLSFVPATAVGAAESTGTSTQNTTTSDILERIDLTGTVVGTCSSPYNSSKSYKDQDWYSTQLPGWKSLEKFVNGNTSDEITYKVSANERGDVYLDLTKKNAAGISADQFKLHYGASGSNTTMPAVTVVLELANGSEVEETFTTNWSGTDAVDPIKWDFEQTYVIKGIYIYSSTPGGEEKQVSFAEIELYQYIEVPYLDTATLNGVDLGQYKIVYSDDEPDYNYTAAKYIQEQILRRTGRSVEIVTDSAAETNYEILVGETNRSLSASTSAPGNHEMKFTINASGTKIALEADYFIIAGAAYYFVDTYIGTENFENTVSAGSRELAPITKPAKNYIMLIGDGMGVMQTRLWEKHGPSPKAEDDATYGYSDGENIFYGEYLPYKGFSKTANVEGTITDSAAGGTALSTGYKTINGYVGRDQYENDIKNLSEVAWDMGKAVGIMSTEGSDGATPASFSAHTSGRYDNEVISDQDVLEAQGYVFVERYRSTADAYNAVFKTYTAEEFGRWDAKVKAGMSKLVNDPDGFFVMYEEAYIDKLCHALYEEGNPNATTTEDIFRAMYRFNQHIAYFMEFAMYNPDTFVLITADHETAGLDENWNPTQFNVAPETGNDHSLQDVPVYVYGQGGEVFHGVTAENTSIGRTFAHIMTNGNANDFGDPQYPILLGSSSGEDVQLPAPEGLKATATTDTSITVTANGVYGGTLKFRINGGEWQSSGIFTGLTASTTYTIEAMHDASAGYIDSDIATITVTTAEPAVKVDLEPVPTNKLTNAMFGYYGQNISGDITTHLYDDTYPANKAIDGTDSETRSGSYNYSDLSGTLENQQKVPVIYIELTEATVLGGVEIKGWEYDRYNMENFVVQITTEENNDNWKTVATVTQAFTEGDRGAACPPLTVEFNKTYTAYKVRILVDSISDMSSEAQGDDAGLTQFGYIRVKEVTPLYDPSATPGQAPGDPTEPTTPPTQPTEAPTEKPTEKPTEATTPVTEPTAPVNPNPDHVVKLSDARDFISGAQFGYYNKGDIGGTIIEHYQDNNAEDYNAAHLFDGTLDKETRAELYLHADLEGTIENQLKVPVILMELDRGTVLGGLKIDYYDSDTYYLKDFVVQVSTTEDTDAWLTVATVTDATYDEYVLEVDFEQTVKAYKIRILVDGLKVLTAEELAEEDEADRAQLSVGNFLRIREMTLYYDENTVLPAPTGLTAVTTDSTVTATADSNTNGTLMFRINGGTWQASGTFTGLQQNTSYTVEAKYVGNYAYMDSDAATITATTASTTPPATEPQPTTRPVDPNDPIKQGTILEIVSPKKVTPALGYISVSDPYGTITEPDHEGEATCLTDGMYYKTAYSKCAASASQYVAAAAILSSATTIGGVEINAHRDGGQDPTAFKIVVKQTDGTWKEVANVTSSPFSDSTRTVMYTFDPVVATEVRVLISAHTGEQVYIAELCLYESKTGNVSTKVDLPAPTGGNGSTSASYLVDGNKATAYNLFGDSAELVFDLTVNGQPTAIDHFALYYARNNDVNPKNVTIEIKKTADGEFETIYTGSTGFNSDDISVAGNKDSFFAAFDQTYYAYDLVLTLSGGGEELYLPEFELYAYERAEAEPEDIPLDAPTGLTATATTDSSITVTANTTAGGTLMFRINGGAWQESGEFTGLIRNTAYTVEAMYVGAEGYTDSGVTSIEVTTEKTAQAAPTGLNVTAKTDTSITVSAAASANGTLQYRINGGAWQASGTFTGLDRNTTYTVEAMYVGANGYSDSGVTSIEVTTNKTAQAAPAGLKATATTDSSITVTANTSANGTLQFRINGGEWKVGDTVTFDGLDRNTTYTVEAMYVGTNGYADSAVTTNEFKTAKTQLSNPTGLISTEITATSITVTANAIAGGTLQYRINGGAWQETGSFTGLDNNTTYTIDAMYVAADGYINSGIASLVVATTKPAVVNNGEYAYLEAIPENAITPHVGYNNYSNHEMYAENTVNGDNINDAMYGTSAQIKGDKVTFTREDLKGQKRLSVVYDLNNGATKIGGVELTGKAGYNITKFLIQVKTDGVWYTVRIVTANPFTESDTVLFTFTPREGDKVRIMIEDYEENANNAPEICEMVVYEVKEDAAQVELPATATDSNVVDGNKATFASTNSVTLTLTRPGQVKRMKLFGYTEEDSIGAYTVEIISGGDVIHTATGNAYGNARAFSTAIVELDQYYQADAVRITASGTVKIPEVQLYGKLTPADPAPEDPIPATTPGATAPTEPTKPAVEAPVATQAATQAATIPTEPAGMQQPTVAAPAIPNESGMTQPVATNPAIPNSDGSMAEPVAPAAPTVTQPATVMGWLDEIPESQMTPHNGYYINGDMNTLTDEYASEAAYLNDAYYETGSYVRGTSSSTSGKVPATVFDLNGTKTIGGLTLVGKAEEHIQTFDIEYYSTATSKWELGVSVTSDPFTENSTQTFLFAEPVECTQVRVLVKSFKGSNPMLQELEVLEFKTGTALVKIPLQDLEANKSANDGGSVNNFADGDRYTRYDVHYNALPVELSATLATGSGIPTTVSRVKLYSHRRLSSGAPSKVVIELKVNGSWIEVYNGTAYTTSSTDTWFVDLPQAYAATEICVTVSSRTGDKTMGMADIEVFGPGESYIASGGSGGTYTPGTAGMTKLDLTGRVVGVCSDGTTSNSDYTNLEWYSTSHPSWKNEWKTAIVNDDYDDDVNWGCGDTERADFYMDLTNGPGGYTAIDKFEMYHPGGDAIPEVTVILVLYPSGTKTFTYTPNWGTSAEDEPLVGVFDQTYNVRGVYVWESENEDATFGNFDLYQKETVTLDAPKVDWTEKNDTSITVTAAKIDASIGKLQFRINGGAWQDAVDGSYTFPKLTGNTTYTIDARYCTNVDGYVTSAVGSAEIKTEETPAAAFTVTGTVKVGSTNLAGATVRLCRNGAEIAQTTTNANGVYTFSNVAVDNYTLVVSKQDHTTVSDTVTVSNGQVTKDFTLTALSYTISGTVTGTTADTVTVQLCQNGSVIKTTTATGTSASYSFTGLASGNYSLVVTKGNHAPQTATVTVNAADATKSFTLDAAIYAISGTVTGSTADTVTVQLYLNGVVKYTATVTPNGNNATYSFSNIPIGNYSLMVTKANHIAKSATVTVDKDLTDQNFALTYVEPVVTDISIDLTAQAYYNIRLVEPWKLRFNVTLYDQNDLSTPIDLTGLKFGAYAVLEGECENGKPADYEELIKTANAVQFRMANGEGDYNIFLNSNGVTVTFDYFDMLYTYRLNEKIYWVVYYEDANGDLHFTNVLTKVPMDVIDNVAGQSGVSESEKRLLNSMKDLHTALIVFRGENAELGKDYTNDEGVLNYNVGLGTPNTTDYQFGKSHRIRLIEPWGVLVSIQVKPRSGSVYTDTDFANADNYGMIFFHDEDLAYNGDMRADQILAMNDVYVYSKKLGNVVLEDGKMTAIYDKDLATSMLDSDVYCLPFVEVDGQYYYSKNAFRINLLDEMYVFYNRTNLSNNERNTFRKMIELYKNTILHFAN